MIKKIAYAYKKLLTALLKVLALVAACFIVGIGIVFPLWKWATTSPSSYTAVVTLLIIAALIYWLVKKAVAAGPHKTARAALLVAAIVGTATAATALLMHGLRVPALITVIIMAFVIFGVIASGKNKTKGK